MNIVELTQSKRSRNFKLNLEEMKNILQTSDNSGYMARYRSLKLLPIIGATSYTRKTLSEMANTNEVKNGIC